jgi:murein DD-endopeptidase MepM/ murein hydrolase activator NlpD
MNYYTDPSFRYRKKPRRRIPLIRTILFIGLVSIVWHYSGKFSFTTGEKSIASMTPVPRVPSPAQDIVIKPYNKLVTYVVRSGDTFAQIVSKNGASPVRAIECYHTLKEKGLTAIFPGDSCVMELAEEGTIHKFSLLSRFKNWYHVTFNDTDLTVEKVPVQTTVYRCLAKGTLQHSLSEDMHAIGVGDAVVARITEIFAWDVNFFTDPRKGDRFGAIFEKRYAEGQFVGYGEVLAAYYKTSSKTFYAIGIPDSAGRYRYFDCEGNSVQKQFLKAPLRYSRISSGYSYHRKHPILGIVRPHLGIDYAAPRGTPVHASADGKVIFAGWKSGYGNFVKIAHGAMYQTYYGHLNTIARCAKVGAFVSQGQCIGTVGATGLATGPHLDYRMRIGKRFVNPLTVTLPSLASVEKRYRAQFEKTMETYMAAIKFRIPNTSGLCFLDIITPDRRVPLTVASKTVSSDGTEEGS